MIYVLNINNNTLNNVHKHIAKMDKVHVFNLKLYYLIKVNVYHYAVILYLIIKIITKQKVKNLVYLQSNNCKDVSKYKNKRIKLMLVHL